MYFDTGTGRLALPNSAGAAGVVVAGDDQELLVTARANFLDQELGFVFGGCGRIRYSKEELSVESLFFGERDGQVTFALAIHVAGAADQGNRCDTGTHEFTAVDDAFAVKISRKHNNGIAAVRPRSFGVD